MSLPKKRKNKIPLPIRMLICATLLFAMYISISTLVLGLWGDTVMGAVDGYSSRLEDRFAGENRTRTVSKSYYFTVNGKEYQGHVIYASDEQWARLAAGETRAERICYLPFFPYINKPAALCTFESMGEFSILYHALAPIGCLFLLYLVLRAPKQKKKLKSTTKRAVSLPLYNASAKNTVKRIVSQPSHAASRNTDMLCSGCGNRLSERAAFCSNCGVKVQQNANACIVCEADVSKEETPVSQAEPIRQYSGEQQRTSFVGFSKLCDHPEILAAAQESKRNAIGCMWILVFVPLIGFPIAGLLMEDFPFGESLIIGIGIALVMFIINLFALRGAKKPMWEGVVVNKYSKERSERRNGANHRTYTEYTTVITTDAGKKKTIVEKGSHRDMYAYLAVGDKVRYHPKFGTYEKYDKSKDRILYCNVCSMMNPIQNERCKRCNCLLFK